MKPTQHATVSLPTDGGRAYGLPMRMRGAGWLGAVPKALLMLAVRGYQLTISPAQTFLFGSAGGCRYTPTCSAYAMEALREHGAVNGTVLAARRICRCHPWGGCGHDPVPPKNQKLDIPNARLI